MKRQAYVCLGITSTISAFRFSAGSQCGISATAAGDDALDLFQFLSDRIDLLKNELGDDVSLTFDPDKMKMDLSTVKIIAIDDPTTFAEQKSWFSKKLNSYSNTLRPLLKEFYSLK